MRRQSFSSRAVTGRAVDLDICYECQGIWFDPFESAQLSPAAILELFEAIRKQVAAPRPLAVTCTCPVCHRGLALTHDFERTNHMTYFRCPAGQSACLDAPPPPAGDGCDATLQWWFDQLNAPPQPPGPVHPPPPAPAACRAVLGAGAG